MTAVLAIDPGTSGAVALLSGGFLDVYAMPIFTVQVGKGKRARVDPVGVTTLLRSLDELHGVDLCVIEQVGPQPRDSAQSAFAFGYGCGILYAVATALKFRVEFVPPPKWMKWAGVVSKSKSPDGTAVRASERFPHSRDLFWGPRGGVRDGFADAALMAAWGREVILSNEIRGAA